VAPLVPRPVFPYEIWQAVTSPPTLREVPRRGYGGVFWLQARERVRRDWEAFAEAYEESHGRALEPGEKRMLVLNVSVGDTRERAMEEVRAGHDEFWKFLGPYGWGRGYLAPDGTPAPAGYVPTLEESMAQGVWAVGTPDDVAAEIGRYRTDLGLTNLVLFPAMPGDSFTRTREQLGRLATEVLPRLGVPA
jgi:alkanesulfonate monooxygenase SsuD/methylene tetrahydromethanopterin reductase-like flavin-dependent oxidoreductase (luciferase family)